MNIDKKVKTLTASDIIRIMVKSLRKPWVQVDMSSWGGWGRDNKNKIICYGCAATNTLCELLGEAIPNSHIYSSFHRAQFAQVRRWWLDTFEVAINRLRVGDLHSYNSFIKSIAKSAVIPETLVENYSYITPIPLPEIENDYTEQDLQAYEYLADVIDTYQKENTK